MGLANVLAAIDAGADRFDASLGGIGGCPYAPGATGNVCTEDIVHALERMGYDTGVDLAAAEAAQALQDLLGHEVPSQILKAGRRLDLHPAPATPDDSQRDVHPRIPRAAVDAERAGLPAVGEAQLRERRGLDRVPLGREGVEDVVRPDRQAGRLVKL